MCLLYVLHSFINLKLRVFNSLSQFFSKAKVSTIKINKLMDFDGNM